MKTPNIKSGQADDLMVQTQGQILATAQETGETFSLLLGDQPDRGLIGIVVGLAGGIALSRATGWPTAVSPLAIFLAFGVSGAVGVSFGAYPARRAARLDPIIALRAE